MLIHINISVPSVMEQPLKDAEAVLIDKEIKYKVKGDGDTVTAQMPLPGSTMPQSSTVILYTGDAKPSEHITVPNLVDYSVAGASNHVIQSGLNVRVVGNANTSSTALVISQSPAAGEVVAEGTVITIRTNSSVGVQN